jgi:two-component system cell cycle response regulator CtrA
VDGDAQLRIEALEAENDRLRHLLEKARHALMVCEQPLPLELRLTGKEGAMVRLLLSGRLMSKEQLLDGMYVCGVDDEPQLKIVDVFVCKARKKIAPYGLSIDTVWGRGYRMPPESIASLRAMMGLEDTAAAA